MHLAKYTYAYTGFVVYIFFNTNKLEYSYVIWIME